MTQTELDTLLQRFESSQATEADRQLLRQLFLANGQAANEQAVLQLGKYGVNIGEGKDVHIGDRYGLNREDLRTIIQELQTLQGYDELANDHPPNKPAEDVPLEYLELEIDVQIIGLINSRLASIEELYNAKQLTESQLEKLNALKAKLRPLVEINQDLRELAAASNKLLQEAIQSLTEKLQELNASKSDSFATTQMQNCLQQYQELLLQLQMDLEEGEEVADWLNKGRSHIAQALGQHALSKHPTLKQATSPKSVEAFYFSLEQFLERLSHCLIWGRQNSLEFPTTPVVLNDQVYATAFEYLMEMLPEELSDGGVEQLQEYVDYLVKSLTNYRHISIE